MLGRAGGVGFGVLMVLVGMSLFTPEAGIPQTPATTALASVVVALGIGAIGAALMPNELTINGQGVKPLGLSGTATGGAAFFVATLVFLYATGVNSPNQVAKIDPLPVQTGTTPAPPVQPETSAAIAASEQQPQSQPGNGSPTWAAQGTPVPPPDELPKFTGTVTPTIYRVRTFCSECCPQGPIGCPNVGWAQAPTLKEAGEMAAQNCIATGGHPDTCYGNLERY